MNRADVALAGLGMMEDQGDGFEEPVSKFQEQEKETNRTLSIRLRVAINVTMTIETSRMRNSCRDRARFA